jgi:TolB protein
MLGSLAPGTRESALASQPAASPLSAPVSGHIAVGHSGEIWVVDGSGNRPVAQGVRYWGQPDWSPDGSRLAVVGWTESFTDLFLWNAEGGNLRQITQNRRGRVQDSDWVFFPRWSPDGETIAFLSDRTTTYPMLWLMRPDGSNVRQLTRTSSGGDIIDSFTWSPDGSRIAATRFSGLLSQVHIVDVARPSPSRPITNEPGGAFDPAWSPDGRYIAYAARDGRRSSIQVIDADGTGPPSALVQTDLGRSPRWSPSGNQLAYLALAGREFELFIVDIFTDSEGRMTAGRPNQVTNQFGVDATSGLSWGQ